jgi:redox-sensitive bicupin YhaK (pirin superfamily)
VIAGEHDGVRGVADTNTPIHVLDVRLEDGARFVRRGRRRKLAYVIEGAVEGQGSGSVLYLDDGEQTLRARGASRLLWMEGDPIGEPIVARGPFVMSTAEEISEAYRDLKAGRLTR